jgi:CRISPR/Cas system-associated exonuclease Cas4 (RecB family)
LPIQGLSGIDRSKKLTLMKPFLLELAENLYRDHKRGLDSLTVVFPNRRAALYFRKHLASLLDRPSFSPELTTIEEFIGKFSRSKVPDKLQLIHTLQQVYNRLIIAENPALQGEAFDQFYFWGEMLLRDFEESDKYMVNVDHLFKEVSHQKEIDTVFDFLSDEQREFLKSFWGNLLEHDSVNKRKFLEIWRKLPAVYTAFREALAAEGFAYEGMVHREVAANIAALAKTTTRKIVFAGFNALTKAEEMIISHFVKLGAVIHWDTDDYYVNNQRQESARFFREYQQHPILGQTFPDQPPANFKSLQAINLYAAAQPIGQAKIMSQVLVEKLKGGYNPEETLVVLPDEKLLMPVLHGISANVEKLNVTMGFPLSSTPLFNLVELLIELQLAQSNGYFNHRAVLALLGHPYIVAADAAAAQAKRKTILNTNWVTIPTSFLATKVDLHRRVFSVPDRGGFSNYSLAITTYLRELIAAIGALDSISDFDKEYCFHFIRLLNRMEEVYAGVETKVPDWNTEEERIKRELQADREQLKSFLRLFRQILRAEKIPFSGEPLRGLQVMGVLETRNLDYKNVFILSLNEGAFPSFSSKGSYIPYNIRKAYGLPTVEQQDAIYAYLFYRMLQRAENVFMFYNSETDELGQGEMSRYLQQILFESGIPVNRFVLHNELLPLPVTPLVVKKDQRVFDGLARYCKPHEPQKSLSPSALNEYIECRLKFYFKYVERIKEAREVEEDLDARVLGNFLHKVMELFYRKLGEEKGTNLVEPKDFVGYERRIGHLIDLAFIENYSLNPHEEVVYEGQRVVVREIVRRFVDRIVQLDRQYAPFRIEALESRELTHTITLQNHGSPAVVLGGSIDRADKKDNIVRVIDYKTGKDDLAFPGVAALFERAPRRNKAAFQTLLYSLLYRKNNSFTNETQLTPGLMNRMNLFNDGFTFGLIHNGAYLKDATPMLPEFEAELTNLLDEIFDPEVPFDQTENKEACQYCQFAQICYR